MSQKHKAVQDSVVIPSGKSEPCREEHDLSLHPLLLLGPSLPNVVKPYGNVAQSAPETLPTHWVI